MNPEKMPAGRYYIGDLCYVMHPEWVEFCELTIHDHSVLEGKFTLADGREFVFFNTMYGDGVYTDREGRQYGVDAGLIGAIALTDITESELKNVKFGNVVSFENEWEAVSANGVLFFGDVVIITGCEDEEYDDDF